MVAQRAVAVEHDGDDNVVVCADGTRLAADAVLVAVGRTPRWKPSTWTPPGSSSTTPGSWPSTISCAPPTPASSPPVMSPAAPSSCTWRRPGEPGRRERCLRHLPADGLHGAAVGDLHRPGPGQRRPQPRPLRGHQPLRDHDLRRRRRHETDPPTSPAPLTRVIGTLVGHFDTATQMTPRGCSSSPSSNSKWAAASWTLPFGVMLAALTVWRLRGAGRGWAGSHRWPRRSQPGSWTSRRAFSGLC